MRKRLSSAILAVVLSATIIGTPRDASAQPTSWNWELVSAGYSPPGYPFGALISIHAASTTDVFLAGCYRCLFRWDGTSFSSQSQPDGANRYSVDGIVGGAVYSAGQQGYQSGSLLKFDGSTWTNVFTAPVELFASWIAADGSVFVVGDGSLYADTGAGFQGIPTGLSSAFNTDRLQAVTGFGPNDLFMGGYGGKILRYDGTSITLMETGTTSSIWAMDGSSNANLFAVGENGTVLRFDGTAWTVLPPPATGRVLGVKALGENSVLVSGDNGLLARWDGTSWNYIDFGTANTLYEIDSPDDGNTLFVVEATNEDVRFRLGRAVVTDVVVPEPTTTALLAVGLALLGAVARRRQARRMEHAIGVR